MNVITDWATNRSNQILFEKQLISFIGTNQIENGKYNLIMQLDYLCFFLINLNMIE